MHKEQRSSLQLAIFRISPTTNVLRVVPNAVLSFAIRSSDRPFSAARSPESRKCSFGDLISRLILFECQDCNEWIKYRLSNTPVYFCVVTWFMPKPAPMPE